MKTFATNKIYFVMITIVAVISMANFQQLTPGYTGAPGETTCTTCHTIANEAIRGDAELLGMPAYVVGGKPYPLSLVVYTNNTVAQTAGFQLTMLNDNGTSHGELTDSDPHVEIENFGNRQYAQHNPAVHFFQGDVYDTIRFNFTWTPSSVDQPEIVQSWYSTLLGNGNYQQAGGQRLDSVLSRSAETTVVPELTASIEELSALDCHGDADGSLEVQITGGLAPVDIQWSTGATSPAINGLATGVYEVTITDAIGQEVVLEHALDQPDELDIEPQVLSPSCYNSSDGIIDLFIDGGVPPYEMYLNSTPATIPAIDLSPGHYQVELIDGHGCVAAMDLEITAPSAIDIVDMEIHHQTQDTPGSILMEVTGGTPSYDYLWEGPDQYVSFAQNPVNMVAGTYYLTITDQNDCEMTDTVVVDFVSATNDAAILLTDAYVSPNPGISKFILHLPEVIANGIELTVYTQDGIQVLKESITNTEVYVCIAASSWAPGLYLIHISQPSTGSATTLRWIKSRM